MKRRSRILLLLAGLVYGSKIAADGIGFSSAVNPEVVGPLTIIFWFIAGLLMVTPLWVPALVPAKFHTLLRLSCLIGAVGTLLIMATFASFITHWIGNALFGSSPNLTLTLQAFALAIASIVAFVILLREVVSDAAKVRT